MVAGEGLGAEPFLEGQVEALDFDAGGRVVGSRVLLHDTQAVEQDLEAVAASGESGREHHPVFSER
jgi:hypothetical protein